MYIIIHKSICVYIYTCICHIYICVCMQFCTYISMYAYIYIYVCIYTGLHVSFYICIYTDVVYIYIPEYILVRRSSNDLMHILPHVRTYLYIYKASLCKPFIGFVSNMFESRNETLKTITI